MPKRRILRNLPIFPNFPSRERETFIRKYEIWEIADGVSWFLCSGQFRTSHQLLADQGKIGTGNLHIALFTKNQFFSKMVNRFIQSAHYTLPSPRLFPRPQPHSRGKKGRKKERRAGAPARTPYVSTLFHSQAGILLPPAAVLSFPPAPYPWFPSLPAGNSC